MEGGAVGTLLDYLGLPDVEHVALERSPLVLALCQIQFEGIVELTRDLVGPFQRALREQYPRVQQVKQFALQIEAGPSDEPDHVQHEQRTPLWRMSDAAGNWTVALAGNFAALEVREYGRFGEFLERLREVIDALAEHVQPTIGTRLGLRYVNEIRLRDFAADEVIHRDLLGPLAARELETHTVQAVQQLLLRFPHEQGINITHGRLPGGSTVQRVGETRGDEGPFYLLDLDVFREFPAPRVLAIDADEICGMVETYHRAIYRLFRWAVTPEYVRAMGMTE